MDTSGLVAFLSSLDQHHLQTRRIMAEAIKRRARLISTSAVVFELLDGLAERDRRMSLDVRVLIANFQIEIIHIDEARLLRAWNFYDARPDKGWSLTDCVSFGVMQERGVFEALTHDHHFEQAGFRALLRHEFSL